MTLSPADFPRYFEAVHGHPPFPWQTRLAREVLEAGWPATMSLPTASGKTAVLDVAVFTLALQARLPARERTAPRRIALVVDRRIVVDDAHARAAHIRQALLNAREGVLAEVAESLRALGGETPLEVAALRGGIYREDRWARTPLQPVILCSTVDQVGSRLLHRGYGLSSRMWPIHAGLLGHDTLVVLDEAHCSRPFLQTLAMVARLRQRAERPIPGPFAAVAMTATPHGDGRCFTLSPEDETTEGPSQAVLLQRLRARKLARLVVAEKGKDAGLVDTCLGQVRAVLDEDSTVRTVLVVVNRVAVARELRGRIGKATKSRKDGLDADCVLLTGRVRPLERDDLLVRWRGRIAAGRDRAAVVDSRPLVVVATQCVEVGADLDVDALVTEACPLDSLRQRLGRLDRLGHRGTSRVAVVIRMEQAAQGSADDPVYGEALGRTWAWLREEETTADEGLDLGIDGLSLILPDDLAFYSAPAADAPLLFPAYCDLWVQTGPEPAVSPEPSVFLHGPQRDAAEVRLVWRDDLDPTRPETWADTVAMYPPVAGETLPLPLWLARRWLAKAKLYDDGSDLAGAAPPRDDEGLGGPPALRWRGPEDSEIATADAIRPGDLLVVPCSRGGCDEEGWNPDAAEVPDLADRAALAARRRPVLRLHPGVLPTLGAAAEDVAPLARLDPDALPEALEDDVAGALAALAARQDLPGHLRPLVATLLQDRRRRVEPHPSGVGLVVSGRGRLAAEGSDFSDEDSTSSTGDLPVLLVDHLDDVEHWARRIGNLAGLDTGLVSDLALAARLHDLGKADPRFQAWLAGGDPVRAARRGLLAKSERLPRTGASLARARARAGYPEGGRHELLSVRLAESAPELLDAAHDRELVLHLVASHHGYCRPFAPVVDDPRPLTVVQEVASYHLRSHSDTGLERLDSGVAERFWILVRRYGWWGLPFLEACLRLGDHRASENPGHGGAA